MIWFIWSIWSVWFNQTDQTDQINKRDQPLLALVARHYHISDMPTLPQEIFEMLSIEEVSLEP